jgi:hypothetical protein
LRLKFHGSENHQVKAPIEGRNLDNKEWSKQDAGRDVDPWNAKRGIEWKAIKHLQRLIGVKHRQRRGTRKKTTKGPKQRIVQ